MDRTLDMLDNALGALDEFLHESDAPHHADRGAWVTRLTLAKEELTKLIAGHENEGATDRAPGLPLPAPPAPQMAGGFTDHEMELSNLAGAVRMIKYGLDASEDRESTDEALSHLEQCLRRLSDQVGDTERRLGWRSDGGA